MASVAELFDSEAVALPALPSIYSDVSRMLNDPYTSNEKISERIRQDQTMVTMILRLTNSAVFSLREEVTSLAGAIAFLGTRTLKNMVLQISLVRMFPFQNIPSANFDPALFWEQSLGTAILSEAVGNEMGIPVNENIWIGGLLHQFGRLLIFHYYPTDFEKITAMQIKDNYSAEEAERKILGISHCEINNYLSERWKFNQEVVRAVSAYSNPTPSMGPGAAIVKVASLLALSQGHGFKWERGSFIPENETAWSILQSFARREPDLEALNETVKNSSIKIRDAVKELMEVI